MTRTGLPESAARVDRDVRDQSMHATVRGRPMRVRPLRPVALVLGIVLLAGCATRHVDVDEALTVEAAKSEAMSFEDEMVADMPEDQIVEVRQRDVGPLLSCSPEAHNWHGGTDVDVLDTFDVEGYFDALQLKWSDREGVVVSRDLNSSDEPRLIIRRPGGMSIVVSPWTTMGFIKFMSYSRCFIVPEGVYPGGWW